METYVIDTNIFLNVLRDEQPYSASSTALLEDVEAGKVNGLASTITLAEILVGAYSAGSKVVRTVDLALSKLEGGGFRFVPVDKAVAYKSAEIRATCGLKLPDAFVAATSLLGNAYRLVTRDKEMYARVEGLRVSTPEELGYR